MMRDILQTGRPARTYWLERERPTFGAFLKMAGAESREIS